VFLSVLIYYSPFAALFSSEKGRCVVIEKIEKGKSNWDWRYWNREEAADIKMTNNRLEFEPIWDLTWINMCVFDKSLGPINVSEYRFLKILGKGIEMIRVKISKYPFEDTCGKSEKEKDVYEKSYRYSYKPTEYVVDLSEISGSYLYSIGLFASGKAELYSIFLCK